jgi:hypothetical protein
MCEVADIDPIVDTAVIGLRSRTTIAAVADRIARVDRNRTACGGERRANRSGAAVRHARPRANGAVMHATAMTQFERPRLPRRCRRDVIAVIPFARFAPVSVRMRA